MTEPSLKKIAAHTGLRFEFDAITCGWGADRLEDLLARAELLADWWGDNFPLSEAEIKIARAITRRIGELGGDVPAALQ